MTLTVTLARTTGETYELHHQDMYRKDVVAWVFKVEDTDKHPITSEQFEELKLKLNREFDESSEELFKTFENENNIKHRIDMATTDVSERQRHQELINLLEIRDKLMKERRELVFAKTYLDLSLCHVQTGVEVAEADCV